MEISSIDPGIRIKGKQIVLTTFIGKSKTPSDAVLLVGEEHVTTFFDRDSGVVFQGDGEYEVKGTKITGFSANGKSMYTVRLEGMSIFVGPVSGAMSMKDKLHEHDVVILLSDDVLSETVMGIFNAKVFLFYGEKAIDSMKAFEKTSPAVNKYVATKDKLPAETEFILLG